MKKGSFEGHRAWMCDGLTTEHLQRPNPCYFVIAEFDFKPAGVLLSHNGTDCARDNSARQVCLLSSHLGGAAFAVAGRTSLDRLVASSFEQDSRIAL